MRKRLKKDVTPEMVVRAYRAKGLRPLFRGYGIQSIGKRFIATGGDCCALGALLHNEEHERGGTIDAEISYRYSLASIPSFIQGFDGYLGGDSPSYLLGVACRRGRDRLVHGPEQKS